MGQAFQPDIPDVRLESLNYSHNVRLESLNYPKGKCGGPCRRAINSTMSRSVRPRRNGQRARGAVSLETPNASRPPIRPQRKTPAMNSRIWPGLTALFLAMAGLVPAPRADDPPGVPADHARKMQQGLALFKAKVRPVLVQHCLDCHGGKAKKGGLDLSDRKPLVDSGVLEGGGKESRLATLIRHEDDPHMPQKAAKLPDATIADIARWIDLGAPFDRPLVDRAATARIRQQVPLRPTRISGRSGRWRLPRHPPVAKRGWARTPVDRFILAALERRGLKPNRSRTDARLIRRVTFDLTGLPPSPDEIDAFVQRPGPRRLRSPRRSLAGVARLWRTVRLVTGWTWRGSPSRTATSRTTIGPSPTTIATS